MELEQRFASSEAASNSQKDSRSDAGSSNEGNGSFKQFDYNRLEELARDHVRETLKALARLGISYKIRTVRSNTTGLLLSYYECNTTRLKNIDKIRGRNWEKKLFERRRRLFDWFGMGADQQHFATRKRVFITLDGCSSYVISAANALGRRPEDVTQKQRTFFKAILFNHAYGSVWRAGDMKQQIRRMHRQGSEFESVTVHEIAKVDD